MTPDAVEQVRDEDDDDHVVEVEVGDLTPAVVTEATDLRLVREQAKRSFVLWLLALVAGVACMLLLLVALKRTTAGDAMQMAGVFLAPLFALLGAASSHYFDRSS